MPIEGQDDDDFAYEDEHIEMESDNQEYEDLDQREFDSRSALTKPEVRFPITPASVAIPELKRARSETTALPPPPESSAEGIPVSPNVPPATSAAAHSIRRAPVVTRPIENAAGRAKPPVKAGRRSAAKRPTHPRAKKRTQPVKKNASKPVSKTVAKKAGAAKNPSKAKKKFAPNPTARGKKRSQSARAPKRRA